METKLPTLIYFPARGRAELIRLVLAQAGVAWREHPVGRGTPPHEGRPTDFAALKASGDLLFEAVPVWEEPDGFRLAQSQAIAVYLAGRHGLLGQGPREAALCEQVLGAHDDVRAELRKLFVAAPEQRAALRAELAATTLPRWLAFFERLLAQNRDGAGFFVGAAVTVADLAVWYLVESLVDNDFGAALTGLPALARHAERIGALPAIAAFRSSPRRPPFVPLPR